MKKLFCFCAALFLVLCCLPQARADVIFEPMNDFYSEHREECEYHDRSYTAKGPNGNVTAYESPESDRVMQTIDNGEAVYISYIYRDDTGLQWGFNGNWDGEGGWIPMPYLELIYDIISFGEEYGHTFVREDGALAADWQGKEVYFWSYPGSTNAVQMTLGEDYMPQYDMVYTDENGHRWGRGMYYFGMRDYWINLDAPDADYETLFPEATEPEAETPAETISQEPVDEIKPGSSYNSSTIVIGIVVVVAASVLLLKKLKYK